MRQSSSSSSQALKLTAGLLLLLTQLAACGQPSGLAPGPVPSTPTKGPTQPGASPAAPASPAPADKPVFASATSKRTLSLESLPAGSGILPASSGARVPGAMPSAAATSAPASSDISVGRGYGGYGGYFPFIGGGDFNSYVPINAEENIFPGNRSPELLDVHAQTILPMLREWDEAARLVESRGNTAPGNAFNPSLEYVQIPALGNEQPIQMRPAWIFRYASTPRKETLTIYVMHAETRAYRVSWSEPHLDLARVKISVAKAQELARQAMADRDARPGYPVYPETMQYMSPGTTIIYDVPANLNWNVSLGQQGKQLLYYMNFSYREDVARPGVPVAMPSAQPSGGFIITQVNESPEPTAEPTSSPTSAPTATPTSTPMAIPYPTPSPYVTATPSANPLPYPECLPEYARYVYIGGSVTLDAVSGKIMSVSRPMRYKHYGYDPSCHAPGASPDPSMTAYPTSYSTSSPSPMPTATATAAI